LQCASLLALSERRRAGLAEVPAPRTLGRSPGQALSATGAFRFLARAPGPAAGMKLPPGPWRRKQRPRRATTPVPGPVALGTKLQATQGLGREAGAI